MKAAPGRARTRAVARPARARPAAPWLGDEALSLLLREYRFDSVLDVGCGDGRQAMHLRAHGKRVTTVSFEAYAGFQPDYLGDFESYRSDRRYDVVWCSHALEHQPNVGRFLQRLLDFAEPEGLLAITVPPARPYIVGGHLTVWNAGLLLYNLIVAGIDCRQARLKAYGYNLSVLVPARRAQLPPLRHDAGDIERLAAFFPMPVRQGFDGRIEQIGWDRAPPR